ncbi:hypothetical protein R3Q06_02485 [Rhodococcus erythropolis]|uniref:hypothetical protein n=1 Tax=Rhodococcus erythropolis TaxID=1833 RepID=UPI0029492CA5|nr:hypothetical protein [Rhodococcus erythropolis]MDV6272358.1 hypothetical protein [Rhodococcus erythropolis]
MTELPEQTLFATTVLTNAEKLDQLCRRMASISARSDGTEFATLSVMIKPVGERERILGFPNQTVLRI